MLQYLGDHVAGPRPLPLPVGVGGHLQQMSYLVTLWAVQSPSAPLPQLHLPGVHAQLPGFLWHCWSPGPILAMHGERQALAWPCCQES